MDHVVPYKSVSVASAPRFIGVLMPVILSCSDPASYRAVFENAGSVSHLSVGTIARQRVVRCRNGQIESLEPGRSILLNLFETDSFDATVERAEHSLNRLRVSGHLKSPRGTFSLDWDGRFLFGAVRTKEQVYEITTTDEEKILIRELRNVASGCHVEHKSTHAQSLGQVQSLGQAQHALTSHGGSQAHIDLLVAYTRAAREEAGGKEAIRRQISKSVANANEVFASSQAQVAIGLVGTVEVPYAESRDSTTDLKRLRNASDGFMDEVHEARRDLQADIVSLVVRDTEDGIGGRGYLMSNVDELLTGWETIAFNVVGRSSMVAGTTLVHEIAHNMGCAHDRKNANGNLFEDSYGYVFRADGKSQSTIMASGPWRVPFFSNPRLSYKGVRIGRTGHADNVRTLNVTAPSVANWGERLRGLVVSPSSVFEVEGTTGGSTVDGCADYRFENLNARAIDIDLSTDSPWVSVDQARMRLEVDEARSARVCVAESLGLELSAGLHKAELIVVDSTHHRTIRRPIELTIQSSTVQLRGENTRSMSFSGTPGKEISPRCRSFTALNTGAAPVDAVISVESPGAWIQPPSVTVLPVGTTELSFCIDEDAVSLLGVGTHQAEIYVRTSEVEWILGAKLALAYNTSVEVRRFCAQSTPFEVGGGFTKELTIDVPRDAAIEDVNLHLTLQHPDTSKVTVWLGAPMGQVALAFQRRAGAGLGTQCGSTSDFIIDDDVQSLLTASAGPFVGRFRPEGPALEIFDGRAAVGAWKLRVWNRNHTALVQCACVEITGAFESACGAALDDGLDCTVDTCTEDSGLAHHEPDDALCNDGLFCNGVETCVPGIGCQPGLLELSDNLDCTTDRCDEDADVVLHEASSSCSDQASQDENGAPGTRAGVSPPASKQPGPQVSSSSPKKPSSSDPQSVGGCSTTRSPQKHQDFPWLVPLVLGLWIIGRILSTDVRQIG